MSDEPQGDGGTQDPTTSDPAPARRADDSTLELQAITDEPAATDSGAEQLSLGADEVAAEDPGIDTEMLAAFLGEPVAKEPVEVEADVLTGAPVVEEAVLETDVLTGAPVDDAVVADEEPAAEAEPAEEIEEVVEAEEAVEVVEAVEVSEESADATDAAGTAAGPVSHAAPRRSVWPTILTIAGVLIALVAVGAGGVYVGRMTASTPNVVVPTDTAAAAEGDVNVASPSMPVGPLPVPAPGTFVVTTARVPTSTWPVVLNGVGQLADDAGTAPGYRLVNAGISGAQVASILASTFGATGTVTTTDTGWSVGQTGEPMVTVTSDPLFSWTYEDPAALALAPAGDPLDPAEAISATTDALAGIGVDIATVEYQVDFADGRTGVSAWQLVGDQRTQLGWRLVFDTDGSILAASGFSSGLQGVPDYPIVGAATAVQRSQQSPWTALPASPVASAPGAPAEEVVPQPDPTGRPTFDLPMSTVDVTGAELGLAQYWQPDGSILLLPSYILTGADGSTWSLLALADSAVSFTDQPFPGVADENGFVAGAFPEDDPAPVVPDAGDGVTDPAGAEDAGVVDENGDVLFDPAADPAATE